MRGFIPFAYSIPIFAFMRCYVASCFNAYGSGRVHLIAWRLITNTQSHCGAHSLCVEVAAAITRWLLGTLAEAAIWVRHHRSD